MRNKDENTEPNRCEYCLRLCPWRFCSENCRDKQEDLDLITTKSYASQKKEKENG